MKRLVILLLLINTLSPILFAQSKKRQARIDSIRHEVFEMFDDTTKVNGLLTLGVSMAIYKPDSAILYYNQALEISQRLNFLKGIANSYFRLGQIIYQVKNDHAAGIAYYQKVIDTDYIPLKSQMYGSMASHFNRLGYIDTALFLLEKATEISIELNDSLGLAGNYTLRGGIFSSIKSVDSAIYFQNLAVGIYESLNSDRHLATGYLNLSGHQIASGDFNRALLTLQKSLDKYKKTNFEPGMSHVYSKIGNIYEMQKDYTRAIKQYQKAAEIRSRLNDLDRLSSSYNSIASIHRQNKNYDSAGLYYTRSIDLNKIKESKHRKLNTLVGLSGLLLEMNELDSAYQLYTVIYEDGIELRDKVYTVKGAIGLAKIAVAQKAFSQANQLLQDNLQAATELGDLTLLKDYYEVFHTSLKASGKFEKAYEFQSKHKALVDSLFSNEKSQEFGRLEAEYGFEKERDMLVFEQQKSELALAVEKDQKRLVSAIGLVIIVSLIIIAFVYYRSYKRKIKSNKELEHQNEIIQRQSVELAEASEKERVLLNEKIEIQTHELATLAMHSNEKNNVLNRLSDKLSTMQFAESNQADMKDLKSIISNNIKKDTSWDTFFHKFESIYPDFFQHLNSNFNGLTLNELKLCGYIKIGMGNNEIMQVANVANSTVKKNLNRLKKKLNLGPDDSIRDFVIGYN